MKIIPSNIVNQLCKSPSKPDFITYLLTYLQTYLLHGAEYIFRS